MFDYQVSIVQLECEKYKDKVDSDAPVCRHADDYCQFRSSCIIHFMEKENRRKQSRRDRSKETE